MEDDSKALRLVQWVTQKAVGGVPPLSGAQDLAAEYTADARYETTDDAVDALIRWETRKNFGTGFVTGVGGLTTLPFAVPTSIGAAWVIQARMAAAIANIYGHDCREDRVQTLVLLSLIGGSAREAVKRAGIQVSTKLSYRLIQQVPGRVLIDINKRVGFRLLTKAGERGIINLVKIVPVLGGFVGGVVDAGSCRVVGVAARQLFRP